MGFPRFLFVLFLFASPKPSFCQDTTNPWFPGDDMGFYRYLEDRLMALGSQRPGVDRVGESVMFEFYITDSGFIDSVKFGQCFNFQLCYQLRQILNTMPRVNASVKNGHTVQERRVYVLDIKYFRDGYSVQPSAYAPSSYSSSMPATFKWGIAIVAVVAMFIVVFK